jgi:GT2 family glycosyltransferase
VARLAEVGLAATALAAVLLLGEGWAAALGRVRAARGRVKGTRGTPGPFERASAEGATDDSASAVRVTDDPAPGASASSARSVTVIVPAWEEAGSIEACIDALDALDAVDARDAVDHPAWDAIVVAGGGDGTLDVARAAVRGKPRFRVIEQQPLGKPAALGLGLAQATGDVVAIVDADTRVSPGWLRALVAPLDGRVRATTGSFLPARDTPVSRAELMARIDVYEVRDEPILQGAATIAIERSLLEGLGGFATDAFADDWELDARLAARGIARAYAPAALVTTERPATFGEYWRNEVRWRRAHLATVRRMPQHLLAGPSTAVRTLLPYLVAWGSVLASGLALVAAAGGGRGAPSRAGALWSTMIGALLLRPVSLVAEVVLWTCDPRWLRDAWVPSILWLETLAASFVASLTPGRATLHFKGPRPGRGGGRTSPGAGDDPTPGRGSADRGGAG